MSPNRITMRESAKAGSRNTLTGKDLELMLSYAPRGVATEKQFEVVRSFLPLRLELQNEEGSLPTSKGNDYFVPFQNLLRESLTALRHDDVETAGHKFLHATLFLREHMNCLGSFSAHVEAFEFVSQNFMNFANWLRNHPVQRI